MPRILIIDDDLELGDMLTLYLEQEGFSALHVNTLAQGTHEALGGDCDLAILDLSFPQGNGFTALAEIRAGSKLPVIILSGRADSVDRVVGLEMGADDYVQKPFEPRELAARIRAVLRRCAADTAAERRSEVVVLGDLMVDRAGRRVQRAGRPVRLTQTEYALLDLLVDAKGAVVEREALSLEALGREISPFDRSLDVHMSNLRRKLGVLQTSGDPLIGSVRGTGYYLRYAAGESTDAGPAMEKDP